MDNPQDIDGTQLWIGSYLYASSLGTYSELTSPLSPYDSSEPQGDTFYAYSCTLLNKDLCTPPTYICPLYTSYLHMSLEFCSPHGSETITVEEESLEGNIHFVCLLPVMELISTVSVICRCGQVHSGLGWYVH